METDVKVKVVSDLSLNEINVKNVIVFCVNIYADSTISHGCAAMIDDPSTMMVRIERTPEYRAQVFALIHEGDLKQAIWYPVTVTRSE